MGLLKFKLCNDNNIKKKKQLYNQKKTVSVITKSENQG